MHNFVLIAVHFLLQPSKHVVYVTVHVVGRSVLVFVKAHRLPTSQLLLSLPAVSQIFVLSGLPGLQQPHVTLLILQMCEHADCVTVPIRDNQ